MRILLISVLFVAQIAAAASQPASDAYRERVNSVVMKALFPVLTKHFGELRGIELSVGYRVGFRGEVQSVTPTSDQPRALNEACIAAVKAAKVPLLPKTVVKEQGRNWIDIETGIGVAR
jgi:hypothetical protein